MIAAILATWLLTQTWGWSPSETADTYRIYWSVSPVEWCEQDMREYPASDCVDGTCYGFVPKPATKLTFFMVVAYNENGKSDHGHGEIIPCPAGGHRPSWRRSDWGSR